MEKVDYEKLTQQALTEPGKLSDCYNKFWRYSFCNQQLARMQLATPEPINTYNGWKKLGRQVKKGEKAIKLYMPVSIKDQDTGDDKMIFILRANWFGFSQTEGEGTAEAMTAPEFDGRRMMEKLEIVYEPFKMVDGNCQGYAKPLQKIIAINPMAENALKTTYHEIAHCLLHADQISMNDNQTLTADVKEVEAELTAYLVANILGVATESSNAYARGYIQNWMHSNTLEKVRYSKVFGAVDKILKAGRDDKAAA